MAYYLILVEEKNRKRRHLLRYPIDSDMPLDIDSLLRIQEEIEEIIASNERPEDE